MDMGKGMLPCRTAPRCAYPTIRGTKTVPCLYAKDLLQMKKAAWLPRRPFLIQRWPHIVGRSWDLLAGGLYPGRVPIGCRCISGQSRSGSRTDAMVSHLRKMTL